MRKHIINILSKVANVLEFCITVLLIVGIALLCLQLAGSLIHLPGSEAFPEYDELLEICFNLIIGVELIRMMYYHSPDTVFELLVFAVARQVIIDHSSAIANLIGALAIAVLFATKKYLFSSHEHQTPMSGTGETFPEQKEDI